MSQFDSNKDYYGVLGVDKDASQVEIDRQYKREAAKHERSVRRSQRQVFA
jgi:preprotein translocase subunit Sec63